jgi:hypothetical protein
VPQKEPQVISNVRNDLAGGERRPLTDVNDGKDGFAH